MKKYENLEEMAYNCDLRIISTTAGTNGYPHNVRTAVIGFESMEEAEQAVQDTEELLCICKYHRRDGWALWERMGSEFEPFNMLMDEHIFYRFGKDKNLDFRAIYADLLNGETDAELCHNSAELARLIWAEYRTLKAGQWVLVDEFENINVVDEYQMAYSEDTHEYAIGVERF